VKKGQSGDLLKHQASPGHQMRQNLGLDVFELKDSQHVLHTRKEDLDVPTGAREGENLLIASHLGVKG